MPTPPLPQEILDKLVDCASKDFDTLKGLALTSPRFVDRSQSYLFRVLVIDMNIRQAKRSILEISPNLLRLVRDFSLTFDFTIPPAHALGRADRQITLWRITKELQGLTKLYIQSYSTINWNEVSPLCQSAIAKLLGHPLQQLSMTAFEDIPTSLILPGLVGTIRRCVFRGISFILNHGNTERNLPFGVTSLVCEGKGIGSMLELACARASPALNSVPHLSLNLAGESNEEHHSDALALISQVSRGLKALRLEYPYFICEWKPRV